MASKVTYFFKYFQKYCGISKNKQLGHPSPETCFFRLISLYSYAVGGLRCVEEGNVVTQAAERLFESI